MLETYQKPVLESAHIFLVFLVRESVVSFAAVIRVVTQRFCCVTTLITAAKERYFYHENIMEFLTVISVAFPATKLFDKCRVSHVQVL